MCSECMRTPCHPLCPNAPEQKAVYKCKYCCEGIVEGDEYVEIDGEYYHRDSCIEDIALELLYEKLDLHTEVAFDDCDS